MFCRAIHQRSWGSGEPSVSRPPASKPGRQGAVASQGCHALECFLCRLNSGPEDLVRSEHCDGTLNTVLLFHWIGLNDWFQGNSFSVSCNHQLAAHDGATPKSETVNDFGLLSEAGVSRQKTQSISSSGVVTPSRPNSLFGPNSAAMKPGYGCERPLFPSLSFPFYVRFLG